MSTTAQNLPGQPELQLACRAICTCSGCGDTSETKPWGKYDVRHGPDRAVLSKTPISTACQECHDLSVMIYAPQKKPWLEIEAQLQTPSGRLSWDEMRARQAGH